MKPRKITARRVGIGGFALAGLCLAVLQSLPAPYLQATTGTIVSYHLWNFLSEYVRTQYAPLMLAVFFCLAVGTLSAAFALRHLRREAVLLMIAGVALLLLICFPTDLADMTTDAVTCGQPNRIEPCTLTGRIHNQLSTVVFAPIFLVIFSICARSRWETHWRGAAHFAIVCGALALCGSMASAFYLHTLGWQGRVWTGLLQRSLVFPTLLWMAGLLITVRENSTV